jgi:hypothetical protein
VGRYVDAQLVPVSIAVGDRLGLTLWAPPWRDRDGEEVEGFVGGTWHVFAFASADELARYLADHPGDDLSGHPAWPSVLRRNSTELRAGPHDLVDFDDVFTLLADGATLEACEAVSKAVQLAEAIASSCNNEELLEVLGREPYQQALLGSSVFGGRAGQRHWQRLGGEVAESWEWVIERLDRHIRWVGDVEHADVDSVQQRGAAATPWVTGRHAGADEWDRAVRALPEEDLPSKTPTVVITIFFGLFGLIPAAIATSDARAAGVRTGRYWASFGWTMLVSFLVWLVLVALLIGIARMP